MFGCGTGFPYSNLHSLNLDWLLCNMVRLRDLVEHAPANRDRYSYVVAIGDSFAEGYGAENNIGWPDLLYPMLHARDRFTIKNGGGGFVTSGRFGTFAEAVANAAVPNADKVSLVVFVGGINDGNNGQLTSSDYKNGVDAFMYAVNSKFPNAEVVGYASPAPFIDYNDKYAYIAASFTEYNVQYNTCSRVWGLSADDSYKSPLDNIHLSNAGQNIVALQIANHLRGGDMVTPFTRKVVSVPGGSVFLETTNKGAYITISSTLPETIQSGVFENVLPWAMRPKQIVSLSGCMATVAANNYSGLATAPQAFMLTPNGDIAFNGSNIVGSILAVNRLFIPWEALFVQ